MNMKKIIKDSMYKCFNIVSDAFDTIEPEVFDLEIAPVVNSVLVDIENYMSAENEQGYLNLLDKVLTKGHLKEDRTGTGTLSIFGAQLRFNLNDGFPLLTTKKVHMKSITHELLWFLSGDTNVKYLQNNNVKIWDEWATKVQCAKFYRRAGYLGPIYGHQWRNFGASKLNPYNGDKGNGVRTPGYIGDGFDQISWVIDEIKTNPNSRRLIVTAWNPSEVDCVSLPPCHTMFQFFVIDGKLSCQLYQRSADLFLGVPFNIASYALLTHMVAQVCNLDVGEFIWTGGDCHIYKNHIEQVQLQLSRNLLNLPELKLNANISNIFDFTFNDIQISNYLSHPTIKADVAI